MISLAYDNGHIRLGSGQIFYCLWWLWSMEALGMIYFGKNDSIFDPGKDERGFKLSSKSPNWSAAMILRTLAAILVNASEA